MDVGPLRWPLLVMCLLYLGVAVILPVVTLLYASFQRLATSFPRADNFTLANYTTALSLDAVRSALWNSLLLGFGTASIGVVLMGFLSWMIYRSRLPGAGAIEYILMFPQAVPRLVFAFGMLWAWLIFPIPIYGTLWLLLIAYLTVFLPLGIRTISGVMLQIDRSLEESAQMCGASWGYRMRTVTMPLLRPGLIAAWLLLFIASVRELGASILLMGPKAKVITPAIVESWFSTSTELTAAMALLADAGRGGGPRPDVLGGAARHAAPGGVTMASPAPAGTASPAAGTASIEVKDLVVRYGKVAAVRGVSLSVGAGEHLTLLGPSGCGKTTTLRAIAGLEKPESGEIRIDGAVVYSSSPRVQVPPEKRGLSMVFQSYAIWPHMTVFDNVAYGLRVRRVSDRELAEKVKWALELVQMGELGDRSASKLSGGQQQRVALARAFVFSPSVLLFDEPLSNLDAKLRAEMRIEIKELQRRLGITSVYVTHDLEEALAISDRIVVMKDGVIEQIGSPAEIYDLPRNAFVADFVGSANLIRGRHRPDLSREGSVVLETAGGALVHGFAVRPARGRRARPLRAHRAREDLAGGRPRRPPMSGPPRSGAGSSRATSRSTTSTGTGGSSSCAARPGSRWAKASRCT